MNCSACGFANPERFRFCGSCGAAVTPTCPSCGVEVPAGFKFCGQCGTAVNLTAAIGAPPARAPSVQERRLVSVLFADLVGFTTLSEQRDPEEVRELLTRYFDVCRRVIERYGGTVEKFIGDAVMAVWGTPVATEDDAERAVRAGLELTQAVAALGAEAQASGLAARAGVVTGEAAVDLGAQGQGMVAGDVVNTAARVQSVAGSGTTFVDHRTRRASAAAIAYEDGGSFELKGKTEPVALYRALRVVAGRSGLQRAAGLEAPFVGRERELRLIKEQFHAGAGGKRAHLISVVGIGGIGKSRLAWEFFKYIDGLSEDIWWHRGRCLPYGEGVTYWALAEMIRRRAEILEEEDPRSSAIKLHAAVERHVPDPEERKWVELRLASLLGLDEKKGLHKEDLFSGWRLFFERLADSGPTVLVFEDLQWADSSLLDFIEYLMEWSRSHPIFVVTLGRPELADKRPTWGSASRNFTSLYLEPLPEEAMDELMCGLVPGLAPDVRSRIAERAEGIPLYAVETVRMLLDRGLLAREGDRYVTTGPVELLEVPETLHALIAARLDALPNDERWLLQDASVAGKTVTTKALAALTGKPEESLRSLLASLVRKELLGIQQDPRSPERGQYGFVQALVQKVCYDTLSKRERKAKHLAVADYLESGSGYDADEIAEVVCAHLLDAYNSAPNAEDAGDIRTRAGDALVRAGTRAESLAANEEAHRYFRQAAALASDPARQAELLEGAGLAAWRARRREDAIDCFETAAKLFEEQSRSRAAARAQARMAEITWDDGRPEEALERLKRAFEVLSKEEPDEDLAFVAYTLARLHDVTGDSKPAEKLVELALQIAETHWLPEILAGSLVTKAILLTESGRLVEASALLNRALEFALEHDISSAALRAYVNVANLEQANDSYEKTLELYADGLALARTIGDRTFEWMFALGSTYYLFMTGGWDLALDRVAELPPYDELGLHSLVSTTGLLLIAANQGDEAEMHLMLSACAKLDGSPDLQASGVYALSRATVARAQGQLDFALASARDALAMAGRELFGSELYKSGFVEGVEAALALEDRAVLEELMAVVEQTSPHLVPPFLQAQTARFRARVAGEDGDDAEAESGFKSSAGLFRKMGAIFYLAVTQLEHGEWLIGRGRSDEAAGLIAEARATFERLRARPWLERVERLPAFPARVFVQGHPQVTSDS
ncbi:MAG: AAA family ATPase [Actinomycetota bacterium]|nr:AAA family ATPase [Actinomycetota bacterium]